MNINLLCFLFLVSLSLQAQNVGWEEELHYDSSQTPALYQEGLKLQKQGSLAKAWRLFSSIIQYDSISTEAVNLRLQRDSLIDQRIQQLTSKLNGKWTWLASGSNWGVGDSPEKCLCERYVMATDSAFHYYKNGQLEFSVDYQLLRTSNIIAQADFCVIDIGNGKKWIAYFSDERPYWVRHVASNRGNQFLTINMQYGCVCGCPEEVFIKK